MLMRMDSISHTQTMPPTPDNSEKLKIPRTKKRTHLEVRGMLMRMDSMQHNVTHHTQPTKPPKLEKE
jgi:hypothetical protein